jgi:hypothetical protein
LKPKKLLVVSYVQIATAVVQAVCDVIIGSCRRPIVGLRSYVEEDITGNLSAITPNVS